MICIYIIANEERRPADYMIFDTKLVNFIQGVSGDLWEDFLDENLREKSEGKVLNDDELKARRKKNIDDLDALKLSLQTNWGRMISNENDENIRCLGEGLYCLTMLRNRLASNFYSDCYISVFTQSNPAGVSGFKTIVRQYQELAESLANAKTKTELQLALRVHEANYTLATQMHAAIELFLREGFNANMRINQPQLAAPEQTSIPAHHSV